jgi:hypothetical protein
MKRLITLLAILVMVAFVPSAGAVTGTLFGGATMQGNQVKLVSDTTTPSSGVNISDLGTLTFAQLTQLATKFNVTNDDCGAGSPRFQINVSTTSGTKNVFVYLGPSPNFTGCTPNTLVDSGNLIGNNDACRFDTSQISPGTQCSTYAQARALVGSLPVTGIQLVVDSGFFFADKEQTVLVCDIRVQSTTLFPCQGAQPGQGKGKGREKVTLCHNGHTITVGAPAVPAHMKHGDHLGACTSSDIKKAKAKAKARAKAKAKKKHRRR